MSDGVEWLFRGRHIRAYLVQGNRSEVIATFDHWRARRDGFADVTTESWISARGFGHLRIETARNDWYLNDDLDRSRAALARKAGPIGPVRLYANSMGCFGALMFAGALSAGSGLLISPNLPRGFADGSALKAAAGTGDYDILYDPRIPQDVWHARVLQQLLPSARLLTLAGGGHPATTMLHKAGRYGQVRRAVIGDVPDAAILASVHRAVAAQFA